MTRAFTRRMRPRAHQAPTLVDPPPVAGRVPPHDLDAEAAVLSAMLLDRGALDLVLGTLKPEHFYSEANARIFQAAQQLSVSMTPVDVVNVASWLRDREWIQKIGGTSYLAQLADATPATGHVESHAKTVQEKWRLRQLIATCQRVAAEGYGDVGEVQDFIVGAAESMDALVLAGSERRQLVSVQVAMRDAFATITAAAERGDRVTGVATGYGRLDEKTSGMHDGDLIIVAARPGLGKTSWVMNVAVNVASPKVKRIQGRDATVRGDGVCVFSLEMPREQLTTRMACSEARVDLGRVRQAALQADDWRRLTEASGYVSSLPIWIDDTSAIGLAELRTKVRRQQSIYDRSGTNEAPAQRVGLVVVDYLQLMQGRDDVNSREQEISEISRGLKALAKDLKVPVVALSQLNRAVETRGKDKRPQLSDLRESGAIEQDADTVIFIYRDDYYNPETSDLKGIAELIIAKQRNGPTGKVKVRFTASCTRFDNLEPGDYPEESDE